MSNSFNLQQVGGCYGNRAACYQPGCFGLKLKCKAAPEEQTLSSGGETSIFYQAVLKNPFQGFCWVGSEPVLSADGSADSRVQNTAGFCYGSADEGFWSFFFLLSDIIQKEIWELKIRARARWVQQRELEHRARQNQQFTSAALRKSAGQKSWM